MNNIIENMASNGIYLKDIPDLDGKIKRFKVDDNDKGVAGWYVGHSYFLKKNGEQFFNVVYGNFKTGETFHYKSDSKNVSSEELKRIQKEVEKAKLIRELEIEKDQKIAGDKAAAAWNSLNSDSEKSSLYLDRKKINSLYGAKLSDSGVLVIPIRDIDGKITSLQSITDSTGEKKFYPQGKIKGCFHTIGNIDESEYILICEGFATGCSLYMATGKPVVIAFQSTNLESVALEIAAKYKSLDKRIIICGDDDAYTVKPPDNEPYNAGRIYADKAAEKISAIAVYPKFKELAAKGRTDFNDLHVYGGLERVIECFDFSGKTNHVFIKCLGHNDGNYFFVSDKNKQIQCLSTSALNSKSGLMRLQPLEYWLRFYLSDKGNSINTDEASNDLIQKCHEVGVFKPESVRGAGVWEDDGRIVYNAGDKLYISGEKHDLHSSSFRTRNIYNLDADRPEPLEPLSKEESSLIYEVAKNLNCDNPLASAMVLTGWLFIAPISGALSWRPHIWLTGASGTGKSYLLENFIFRIIKNFSVYMQGGTSEAGLRAATSNGSFPVVFDEFETNDVKSGERVAAIIELARQASSSGNGYITKSTAQGGIKTFKPQFSMMVSSVRVGLEHEEDVNRFAIIELNRGGNAEQFKKLNESIKKVFSIKNFSERLFSRALNNVDNIKISSEILKNEISKKYSMRKGQQFGSILSGFWHLTNDNVITQEEAENLVRCANGVLESKFNDLEDEMNCLNYLLDSTHDFENSDGKRRESVRYAIYTTIENKSPFPADWTNWLAKLGIKILGDNILIVPKNKNILDIYKSTKWSKSLGKTLLRIEDSRNATVRINGSNFSAIKIPLDSFYKNEENNEEEV